MKFQKKSLPIDEQIQLLKDRGLLFSDEAKAKESLNYIGYYRLSAYGKFYQEQNETFREGIDFNDILHLYIFDRKLKLLFFDAIERIEIALRTLLTLEFANPHGNLWYLKEELFGESFDYEEYRAFLEERIQKAKRKTLFVQHFYDKYTAEEFPPSWMMMEILTFGEVLRIYRNLKRPYRKDIAKKFGLKEKFLTSWLGGLAEIRNICAHHERLWNKMLRPPKIPKKSSLQKENRKVFNYILVVLLLMETISPNSDWRREVNDLLNEYSRVPKENMGFPKNWEELLREV
jgi:abortive infection bacteriophage resistance protein